MQHRHDQPDVVAWGVPRFRASIPIDEYIIDVLMRDLVGHDQHPAAFLVFLFLYGRAVRAEWRAIAIGLRELADETGLSRSAVQKAIARLERRQLIRRKRAHRTARPEYSVLRHWRA